MKKKKKIWPIVLLLILIAIVATAYFQRNNLKAAFYLIFRSDQIDSMMRENDKVYDEAAKQLADEGIDISDEKLELISGGGYTEQEIIDMILSGDSSVGNTTASDKGPEGGEKEDDLPEDDVDTGSSESLESSDTKIDTPPETVPEKQPEIPPAEEPAKGTTTPAPSVQPDSGVSADKSEVSTKPENIGGETTDPVTSDSTTKQNATQSVASQETARCIAKLYVIKSRFTEQLTALEEQIFQEYKDLPKDQQIPDNRKSVAIKYVSRVAEMEKTCDAEVEELLSELKQTLEAEGKDTSIITTLKKAYNEEKSLKKAFYLNVYTNGL